MSYNRKFNEECLTAHNAFRSMHNAPDLRLNPDLAIAAQTWAQKLAESGRLQHCPDCGHGENLAVRWTSTKADFNGEETWSSFFIGSEIKCRNHGELTGVLQQNYVEMLEE